LKPHVVYAPCRYACAPCSNLKCASNQFRYAS